MAEVEAIAVDKVSLKCASQDLKKILLAINIFL